MQGYSIVEDELSYIGPKCFGVSVGTLLNNFKSNPIKQLMIYNLSFTAGN